MHMPQPGHGARGYSRVTRGAFLPALETWISPALSSSFKAWYLVLRWTPNARSCSFEMVKVLFLALHAMCSSQIHTKAFGVEVARAACSAHHSGTLTNRSEALRARPTLGGAAADTRRWKAWNSNSSASFSSSRIGSNVLLSL